MSKPVQNEPAQKENGRMIGGACPICGKPAVLPYRPFCSKHCADVDLSRWLNGHYAVASVENGAEDSLEDDENNLP